VDIVRRYKIRSKDIQDMQGESDLYGGHDAESETEIFKYVERIRKAQMS